ncbi:MAG: TPM domain-containing protein [Deferrisomatales bacterium]|nr:TPM domain-containing protein [Deferrisomatales bacterium]
MRRWLSGVLVLFVLVGCGSSASSAEIPYLTGRVTDNAEILGAETRSRLTERLADHEARTGAQVAVLTVATLNGGSIEPFAAEVFQAWGLGQRGADNGVLMVVVPNDRRMRIEVGYGLEATLTDLLAGRIIRDVMTPRFRAGDYDGGVEAGVDAILRVLQGGGLPEVPAGEASARADPSSRPFFEGSDLSLPERILIGAFVFGIIGLFTVIGILTPGVGWFLYLFLIPFWAMFPVIVVGTHGALYLLGTYLVGFPVVKLVMPRTPWYEKARQALRTRGGASIGGFTVKTSGSGRSWSSGGSSRSRSFGGGGFSGGGGSSGGGGASGGW